LNRKVFLKFVANKVSKEHVQRKFSLIVYDFRIYIIAFIIFSFIISQLPYFSSFFKSIFATITFYIFPLLIGWVVTDGIFSFMKINIDPDIQFVFSYFFGILLLFVSFVATINLTVWDCKLYFLFWIILVILFLLLSNNFKRYHLKISEICKIVVASVSGGLLPTIIEGSRIVYPSIYDPGTAAYIFQELQIAHAGSLEFFVTVQRLPLVMLLGILSNLYNVHPIYLNYLISKTFYFILSMGTFMFARKLVQDDLVAFTSSFVVPWVANMPLSTDATPPAMQVILYPFALLIILYLAKNTIKASHAIRNVFVLSIIGMIFPVLVLLQSLYFSDHFYAKIILLIPITLLFVFLKIIKDIILKLFITYFITIVIVFTFLHTENALFYMLQFSGYFIVQSLYLSKKKFIRITGLLFYLFTILFIYLQISGIYRPQSNFLLTRYIWGNLYDNAWFNMNATQKINWLIYGACSYPIFASLLASIPLAMVPSEGLVAPVAILCTLDLFILFFPEGHFWRIYGLLNVLGAILISYILLYLISAFIQAIFTFILKSKRFSLIMILRIIFAKTHTHTILIKIKSKYAAFIFTILITLFLLIPMPVKRKIDNIESVITYINKRGSYSYVTTNEIFLALSIYEGTLKYWVRYDYLTNLPTINFINLTLHSPKLTYVRHVPLSNDTLLVSDPYTMLILGQLSGRDVALVEKAFIVTAEYSKEAIEQMNFLRDSIFKAKSPLYAYQNIYKISSFHKDIYIILSERTIEWIKSNNHFIISSPLLSNKDFVSWLTIFNNSCLFIPEYYMDNIIVLKLNSNTIQICNETYSNVLVLNLSRYYVRVKDIFGQPVPGALVIVYPKRGLPVISQINNRGQAEVQVFSIPDKITVEGLIEKVTIYKSMPESNVIEVVIIFSQTVIMVLIAICIFLAFLLTKYIIRK